MRDLPFADRQFGAAYVSHVLDGMPSIEDAMSALSALYRVADHVITVSIVKVDLWAWVNRAQLPLWVSEHDGCYIIEEKATGRREAWTAERR